MATQSYGGSGLFGQPSFGDYSGLSGGVPIQMTPEEIQKQLDLQQLQDYENIYANKYESPESSAFNTNVNSRYSVGLTNPYVNTPRDPLRTALLQADYIKQQEGNPVEAINQMDVRKDLPPAPNGQMWEFDANSNQYVLVDDPLSNLSQDASQTAPVASAQQVVRPAPPIAPAPAPASSSIIPGMFPEVEAMQRALYQQKQNEAMQAQAMQFARLSPMERAQYSLYMGGQQLGGAIGSALGGKDPQLQLISMRNAISRQIDMRSPESYYKAATLANQAGDREFATSLVDAGRKLELDTSLIQQRTREKQAADPFQQLLRTGKYTPASMKAYELSKDVADLREVDSPNKIPAKIQEAQTVAKNKGFTEGTPEFNAEVVNYLERPEKETQVQQLQIYRKKLQDSKAPASDIAEVDAAIKALAEGSGTKIIMPGQPVAPKDWLAFISQISKDPVMDRTSTVISDAPNAIETIKMSTTNDIAAASLPGSLARLTGEGKNMSDRDIARYARTGGLDDRVAQDVVGFFTGRKTTVTKEQAERFATAVYRGALLERKKFIQDQAEQAGYKDTPNYAIAIRQLDDQLAKFKLIKPNDQTRESLPKATTEFDSDKEKRYQEWKNKQGGANK